MLHCRPWRTTASLDRTTPGLVEGEDEEEDEEDENEDDEEEDADEE